MAGNRALRRVFGNVRFSGLIHTAHGLRLQKELSAGFLLVHDLYCVVVDLPQLLHIHALQLLNDAHGEGVCQIVISFILWREFPWSGCHGRSHTSSFGGVAVAGKWVGRLKTGHPERI